jgi:hypothetical protein
MGSAMRIGLFEPNLTKIKGIEFAYHLNTRINLAVAINEYHQFTLIAGDIRKRRGFIKPHFFRKIWPLLDELQNLL